MIRAPSFGVLLYRILTYPYSYRSALTRLLMSRFPSYRPHYLACMYDAATLAHHLGYTAISVLEFGVAGGSGLVAIERYAEEVRKKIGVRIESYGFDMGHAQGLPASQDYRDMPYLWQTGSYKMDEPALRKRLRSATLLLGDVATTINDFAQSKPAPLGVCFFDLDYWSSTLSALKLFDEMGDRMLPRVTCYFDDIHLSSRYTGVLAAIGDFNKSRSERKIFRLHGHHHDQKFGMSADKVMHLHAFCHPLYNRYIPGVTGVELPLN